MINVGLSFEKWSDTKEGQQRLQEIRDRIFQKYQNVNNNEMTSIDDESFQFDSDISNNSTSNNKQQRIKHSIMDVNPKAERIYRKKIWEDYILIKDKKNYDNSFHEMIKNILYEEPEKIQLSFSEWIMGNFEALLYNLIIDGKHTNRFILVSICEKELKETEEDVIKQYNELMNRDCICDVVILGYDLPKTTKFYSIKVLGDNLQSQSQMHIINVNLLNKCKNSTDIQLEEREIELLEQIRDKHVIDINGPSLSSYSSTYIARDAFDAIQDIGIQYMYPAESLSYRSEKEYFEEIEVVFTRKLANFFQIYGYNIYANLKPFTKEQINEMIKEFLKQNEVILQFLKEDKPAAVKIITHLRAQYTRQLINIVNEMNPLFGTLMHEFNISKKEVDKVLDD